MSKFNIFKNNNFMFYFMLVLCFINFILVNINLAAGRKEGAYMSFLFMLVCLFGAFCNYLLSKKY